MGSSLGMSNRRDELLGCVSRIGVRRSQVARTGWREAYRWMAVALSASIALSLGVTSYASASTHGGSDRIAHASNGVLTDGINTGFPPFEYNSKSGSYVGSDIDLAKALAKQMNMTLDIENTSFTSLVPGVADGRYDMVISGITDTAAREKIVNFVDYYEDGTSLLVRNGNPAGLSLGTSLCGKTVSAVEDSTQTEVAAPILQKECSKSHKAAIKILGLPESADPTIAVLDGRSVAGLIDSADGAFVVKTSPNKFSLASGLQVADAPIGAVVSKKNTTLLNKIKTALAAIIANGTYKAIMTKWGLTSGEVTKAQVNGA